MKNIGNKRSSFRPVRGERQCEDCGAWFWAVLFGTKCAACK